jgi:hypothetical protein
MSVRKVRCAGTRCKKGVLAVLDTDTQTLTWWHYSGTAGIPSAEDHLAFMARQGNKLNRHIQQVADVTFPLSVICRSTRCAREVHIADTELFMRRKPTI